MELGKVFLNIIKYVCLFHHKSTSNPNNLYISKDYLFYINDRFYIIKYKKNH
jgi:hypothetical protein